MPHLPCLTRRADFSDLKAVYFNGTLKKSPETSNTQGLIEVSRRIMEKHGVTTRVIRTVDHDIASGVYPDMREHGWATDEWPELYPAVRDADILVVAGPIWLGDNSSQTKKLIERLYAHSGELNDKGQWAFYPKVGGCLITGNEDGIKHCAMNVLYSLQHIGYTIPPQADAGWIGEVGPGPELPRRRLRRPGKRLHQPQHHLHDLEPAAPGPDAQGRRRHSRLRQPARGVERRHPFRLRKSGIPLTPEDFYYI